MLIYLIKLSLSLSLVWLFYQLVLRRLTFYNANRWYLLLYTAASFLIPFIDISVLLQKNDLSGAGMVKLIPSMESYTLKAQQGAPALATQESLMPWWMVVFLAGALFVFVRVLVQVFSMYRLRSKARLLLNDEVKLYEVDEAIAPFSFGNAIFVNRQLHDNEELEKIIRHEFVHVRQRHSLDVLWGEMLCMLNWYNPFAWLIRRSIRQNLEFIADHQVLGSGVDRKQYQYLLLKVTGGTQFRIASQFNFSSLKKRIVMMNKVRTAKVHLLRFFFVLPVAAVLLLAFRSSMGQHASSDKRQGQYRAAGSDTTQPISFEEFKKRNPLVESVSWMSEPYRMIIRLKNGQEETYNLENTADMKKVIRKYGGIPASPPPPPPPAVANMISISKSGNLSGEDKAFFTRNPDVKRVIWIDKEIMEVHSTSGMESYALNNESEMARAEKKYGRLPALPVHSNDPEVPQDATALKPPPPPGAVTAASPAKVGVPAPPVPPDAREALSLEADSVIVDGEFTLIGGEAHKDAVSTGILEISNVTLSGDANALVMIDGKQAEKDKRYKGHFQVNKLSKADAVKKYGEKGKNGVVELTSVSEVQ